MLRVCGSCGMWCTHPATWSTATLHRVLWFESFPLQVDSHVVLSSKSEAPESKTPIPAQLVVCLLYTCERHSPCRWCHSHISQHAALVCSRVGHRAFGRATGRLARFDQPSEQQHILVSQAETKCHASRQTLLFLTVGDICTQLTSASNTTTS